MLRPFQVVSLFLKAIYNSQQLLIISSVISLYKLEFSRPKYNKILVVLGIIKAVNLLRYNICNSFGQRISLYLALLCRIKINKEKGFLKASFKLLKAFLSRVSPVK
jgi:hypothetical protein